MEYDRPCTGRVATAVAMRRLTLVGVPAMPALTASLTIRRAQVEEAESLSAHRYVAPLHIAAIYAGLGDTRAFEWLEKGLEDRSWLITWLDVDPLFDPIRDDERFGLLARRVWR